MTDTSKIPAERVDVNWEEVGGGAALPLFHHEWSDHLLTDTSYLRADTFSWQDGNIYFTAYNELVNEKNLTSTPAEETIAGISITYYRTPKGYKIVLATSADAVAQIYEATGIAWYYILDTDNKRFKLPRNSRYESGTTTDNAGDFDAESLPNFEAIFGCQTAPGGENYNLIEGSCEAYGDTSKINGSFSADSKYITGVRVSPSIKEEAYQDGAKVNTDHVTQFLYFYVGNTKRGTSEIDIASITESLNNKVDIDLGNISSNIDYVVESYQNGTEWYKIYKSGWVEQGGEIKQNVSSGWNVPITFLKNFADTNYTFFVISGFKVYTNEGFNYYNSKTEESINAVCPQGAGLKAMWRAEGQGASE